MAAPSFYNALSAQIFTTGHGILLSIMLSSDSQDALRVISTSAANNISQAAARKLVQIWEPFLEALAPPLPPGITLFRDICSRQVLNLARDFDYITLTPPDKFEGTDWQDRNIIVDDLEVDINAIDSAMKNLKDDKAFYYFPEPDTQNVILEAPAAEVMLMDWIWAAAEAMDLLFKDHGINGFQFTIRGQVAATEPNKSAQRLDHAVVLHTPEGDTIILVIIEEKRPGTINPKRWEEYLATYRRRERVVQFYETKWSTMFTLLEQVREYSARKNCKYCMLVDAVAFIAMRWNHDVTSGSDVMSTSTGARPMSPSDFGMTRDRRSLEIEADRRTSTDSSGRRSDALSGRMSIDSAVESLSTDFSAMSIESRFEFKIEPRNSQDDGSSSFSPPLDECDYKVIKASDRNNAPVCANLLWLMTEAIKDLNRADIRIPKLIVPN